MSENATIVNLSCRFGAFFTINSNKLINFNFATIY